ncbi:MFS transporter [Streptomyces sp. VRA16 Mangrove soil]|uniref:MFS transporter n=1 Tax=Streptomyces sp. VRA16 Mangrove soil TaxID=2817434 RepID=UPI001A9D0AB5|nr:MFS transporter [Streptomyces sp. VRA16 Mangrove soil]MBO1332915.1 MFS transporter [Streptomyces sp. VRA16 Mangrove soil]
MTQTELRYTAAETAALPAGPRRALLLLMAVATGLSCAGNYVAQPLLDLIAQDLHLGSVLAGLIVTASQAGYALGLMLLIPLGDVVDRRRLAVTLFSATALFLTVSALAPSGPVLLAGTILTALTSVGAQVVVAHTAALATEATRGRAVATVMSGILLGGLLARTAAGGLSELGGWRTAYWVLAVLMAAAAVTLHRRLPTLAVTAELRYPALIRSTLALLREEPALRRRSLLGALSLASYSVQLTSLTFLLSGAPYRWSAPAIGLFGLVGAVGVLAMTFAARLSDGGHIQKVTGGAAVLQVVSWLILFAGQSSLAWLAIGVVTLNIGQQAVLNSSQTVIYALRPEARSRINSAFMTSFFLGGATGSALASVVWAAAGWTGVSTLGVTLSAGVLAVWLWERARASR